MAASDNVIVLSANPNGKFVEGYIGAITPKPGTAMQIDADVEQTLGRDTWEVFDAAYDGGQPTGPIIILLEDDLRGISVDTAYTGSERVRGYIPEPGDELNLRVANQSGTADVAIGTGYVIDDGTGLFIPTSGSPEVLAAISREAYEGDNNEQLVHMIWGGY